jgi:long-chain acyl-CoA synthetase
LIEDIVNRTGKIEYASIYPDDAIIANAENCDVIRFGTSTTIPCLFAERVKRSGDKKAYTQFDTVKNEWVDYSWNEMSTDVARWRRAIIADNFKPGERAAIRLSNSREWVLFDQAVLAQGMVVVPVYMEDRADNISYILEDTGAALLLLDNLGQWQELEKKLQAPTALRRVVILHNDSQPATNCNDSRVVGLTQWLDSAVPKLPAIIPEVKPDDLATVVYTSGTTGKPKGVMLSHSNMFLNAYGGLQSVAVFPSDQFLSFLPLSHMFERTVGYYLTMMAGAAVAFNRSIPDLPDDLADIRPTAMITVPRIFEKVYAKMKERLDEGPALKRWLFDNAVERGWQHFEHQQGRSAWQFSQLFYPILKLLVADKVALRFGGRLRFVVSGGARLPPTVAKVFIGLGIDILQGYGLTECSPVLTVNTLERNKPASIGLPLFGAELKLGQNNELLARGPYVMQGYWNNTEATAETIDHEGWLSTGDIAEIAQDGFISITGRIKEIIVLANGEKVPPADLESAISEYALFEQAMVVGEGKAYLTAVIVLNPDAWPVIARSLGVQPNDKEALKSDKIQQFMLEKIAAQLTEFPGYAFIRRVMLDTEAWNVEDGSMTPTLKLKRSVIMERFKAEIEGMYDEN